MHVFIAEWRSLSCTQRTDRLQKLIRLLDSIESSLHLDPTQLHTQAEVYGESPELLTCVYSLYHLNRLLLHATVVPAISGCVTGSFLSPNSIRKHAETVLQQANALATLLQQFIAESLDVTRLWPLTGYGAFVASNIFMVSSLYASKH